jgi:hypothetical protein
MAPSYLSNALLKEESFSNPTHTWKEMNRKTIIEAVEKIPYCGFFSCSFPNKKALYCTGLF